MSNTVLKFQIYTATLSLSRLAFLMEQNFSSILLAHASHFPSKYSSKKKKPIMVFTGSLCVPVLAPRPLFPPHPIIGWNKSARVTTSACACKGCPD